MNEKNVILVNSFNDKNYCLFKNIWSVLYKGKKLGLLKLSKIWKYKLGTPSRFCIISLIVTLLSHYCIKKKLVTKLNVLYGVSIL